ncbi:signal peptidase I [Streptococcus henryi]|uniref:signal peptidase I n=1 Tax=Streptococcus henryi TaxID=439219 RepID=UPI00036C0B2B|nr:signal peptidase I [Streptococcus henryi]
MVKRDFIRNIILALLAILTVVLLRIFIFSTFRVHEDAANQYLRNNDVVLVNRNRQPKYKDFIVYEVDGIFYISRIIASEGEAVTYMDDIFYLDEIVEPQEYIESVKNNYLAEAPAGSLFTDDFTIETLTDGKEDTIPKNEYLVLNDDRRNTNDSRKFGLIKKSQIRGVVTFRILPLSNFGFTDVE